jgi:hypothetical protein
MKNQFSEIPAHLQQAWETISEELRLASEELHEAQKRYHKAVLARIAFTETVNKSTD